VSLLQQALLFLIELHVSAYRRPVGHFESKERLGKGSVLRLGLYIICNIGNVLRAISSPTQPNTKITFRIVRLV